MNDVNRDRNFCENLLRDYTKNENLIKHAISVEACVRAYAEKFGEDIEYWSNVALLHDFDYEKFPTEKEHPFKGAEILKEKGFDNDFIDSILSHADYTNIPRDTLLKKVLFACDELAGFITAVALVRPNRKLSEVEVNSVKKKMKDKAFAKNVSREDIINGAKELNIPLEEHIQFCINALNKIHQQLGL